jgi:hypothetical protein
MARNHGFRGWRLSGFNHGFRARNYPETVVGFCLCTTTVVVEITLTIGFYFRNPTRHRGWNLTIDRACHVTGSMSYNTCSSSGVGHCGVSVQLSISAWRSADGSRLTGFQRWQCPYVQNPSASVPCLSNFELVAGQ